MNLNNISITPYVQGVIKIDSEIDAQTQALKTLGRMVVSSRTHAVETGTVLGESVPKLAKHPISEKLMDLEANKKAQGIVEVPVKMFFNKPENALSIRYQAFDENGVPVCSGNGKTCRRLTLAGDGTQTYSDHACPGNENCAFAATVSCSRHVKMTVQIQGADDPLSVFELRSSSINTYRTLLAQLKMLELRYGGLRHIPLKLALWQASNQLSEFQPFDVFRLAINAKDEAEAMRQVKAARLEALELGLVDNFDDVFSGPDDQSASFEEDFALIAEFHEDMHDAGRRAGTQAAAKAISKARVGTVVNGVLIHRTN